MGDVVISGVTYDIYGTHTGAPVLGVLSAQQYFAAALQAASYTSADGATQKKALVTAARMFNRTPWQGTLDVQGQALAWPRDGVLDCEGNVIPDGTIPLDIIYGSYELANALLGDATVQTTSNSGSNVKRQLNRDKLDVLEQEVETEYFRPTNTTAPRFPTIVQELVGCYMESGSAIVTPFVSGTEGDLAESQFDEIDETFGFSDPGLP